MSTLKVTNIESPSGGGVNAKIADVNGGQLSNRNLITNGAMQVAQRGTSATVADNSNEGYSTLDQWAIYYNSSMSGAVTFSQSSDAPSGFANSAKLQCSTTNTSITGNQYLKLVNKIEAQNCQLLDYGNSSAKSSILSWYMKTDTYTGPISVSLEIEGGQEYFTVSATPTTSWARYTLAIPGSTSQAIADDNGEGLTLHFALAGSTSSSNAASSDSTAWSSTRSDYRTDIGNLLSSTSNAFYVTGVQLEVGDVATAFEHRSYGDELARCQRYFQRISGGNDAFTYSGKGQGSDSVDVTIPLCVPLRASPTMNAIDSRAFTDSSSFAASSSTAPTVIQYGDNNPHLAINCGGFSGLTNNEVSVWGPKSNAIEISAEL